MDLEEMYSYEPVVKPVQKKRKGESVKNLIDTDYRAYAMYTIEHRAIPSVIDGFKTSQRKLFYAMQQHGKGKIKVAELGGSLSAYGYGHSEDSAQDTAVKMAQEWRNTIPVFLQHGNFGTRIIQDAAAPRYIYASMNPIVEQIFNDTDVMVKNIDPDDSEPHHYLPIIPWVLLNGIKGVAVGFASDILPRTPTDLVQACKEYLKTGNVKNQLFPTFPRYFGTVDCIGENKYTTSGKIEKGLRNSYVITELPWGYDREYYFEILVEFVESKKIVSFEDHCDKTGFKFIIKMDPDQRNTADQDLLKYFKLVETHTENLTTLDENGKLKIFKTPSEIIAYFCDYRVRMKSKQLKVDISKLQKEIDLLIARDAFIQNVLLVGVDVVSKWQLSDFKTWISERVGGSDFTDLLSRTAVYKFTADEIMSLKTEIQSKKLEKTKLESYKPEEILLKDIIGLKL